MHSTIEVPSDHPAYAGHFPKFPVLPGAVLLDEALQVIQRERGIDIADWRIASAKFLDVVRPSDSLHLEHETLNSGLIRFSIHATARGEDRTVATGNLSPAAPPGALRPGPA